MISFVPFTICWCLAVGSHTVITSYHKTPMSRASKAVFSQISLEYWNNVSNTTMLWKTHAHTRHIPTRKCSCIVIMDGTYSCLTLMHEYTTHGQAYINTHTHTRQHVCFVHTKTKSHKKLTCGENSKAMAQLQAEEVHVSRAHSVSKPHRPQQASDISVW